jgi:hypothetical protein
MKDVSGYARRNDIGIVGCTGSYERLCLFDAGLNQNFPVKPQAFYDTSLKGWVDTGASIGVMVNNGDIMVLVGKELADLRSNPSEAHNNDFHNCCLLSFRI